MLLILGLFQEVTQILTHTSSFCSLAKSFHFSTCQSSHYVLCVRIAGIYSLLQLRFTTYTTKHRKKAADSYQKPQNLLLGIPGGNWAGESFYGSWPSSKRWAMELLPGIFRIILGLFFKRLDCVDRAWRYGKEFEGCSVKKALLNQRARLQSKQTDGR